MSRDPETKNDSRTARLYDKRTVERSIKKGVLSRKDYEKYIKSLEDVADKGVYGAPVDDDDDEDLDTEDVADEAGDDAVPPSNSHS